MAMIGNTIKIVIKFFDFDGTLSDATDISLGIYEDAELLEEIPLDVSHKVATGTYEYKYIVPDGDEPLVIEAVGTVDGYPQVGQIKVTRFTRR